MKQNTKFEIWHRLLVDAIPMIVTPEASLHMYHRVATAWGLNEQYWFQGSGSHIDLTKIYEQAKLLDALTNTEQSND